MDYEVFEPNNEKIAQIIVRILEERGYSAGYQLGYPNNKIFINVDSKGEADRISGVIRRFMDKFSLTERGTAASKLDTWISKLSSLIPETPEGKREKFAENIEKKIENSDHVKSEISESEICNNAQLEELRSKIFEKLNLLNTLMTETPKDPSNEKRKIESDTLIWVLQNIP
jgi:hypothetical protein